MAELVQAALDGGMAPAQVLSGGLIAGMDPVGKDFKAGELFVPQVLIAARAMHAGMGILRPLLTQTGVPSAGKYIMGLSTYVNRMAPPEELTPTLSAGVSVNHVTSVSMSLLAGTLLSIVGYEALCWGAAAVIMLSVPFALAIKIVAPPAVAQRA